jgi:hypothetical protein
LRIEILFLLKQIDCELQSILHLSGAAQSHRAPGGPDGHYG